MADIEKICCGLCHYEFNRGARVCQGCQGTVIYGATNGEIAESRKLAGYVLGLGSLGAVYGSPMLANSQFGLDIPVGFGLGGWGFGVALVAALIGAQIGGNQAIKAKRGQVRTFRSM